VEVVVSVALAVALVAAALGMVEQVRHAERRVQLRMDALLSHRLARTLMRSELGWGRPGRDWWVDRDSVALRAFRGTAVLCDSGDSTSVGVSYRGSRRPDTDKDSVLLVHPDGSATAAALLSSSPVADACGWTGEAMTWRLDPAPAGAVLARVYERGSYHFSGGALRYRRGRSGRQPLTPPVWSAVGTGWIWSGARIAVELAPSTGGPAPPPEFLAWAVGR